jgi:tRNA(Leu) C34 or U34 (ribose-2'-O)-methylase TrmL
MARGFAVVALDRPKDAINVGTAMRAVGCYDAAMLVTGGARFGAASSDTQKAYRHIPLVRVENVFDAIPFDCIPVAVEITEDAIPLHSFQHPERAFYIFGPEDGSIRKDVSERCKHHVYIPTRHCLNLGMAVNTVLYDRQAKQLERGKLGSLETFSNYLKEPKVLVST